jgi:hypothetical protein
MKNTLDSDKAQAYLREHCRGRCVRDKPFNPDEEPMGSITFGNATPATMTGSAMPRNIKINRAGFRRVRMMVAPH